MNWTAGLAASLLLAGCATTECPPAPAPEIITKTRVTDTACDWTRPIYLDKSDVLSDATAKAILGHNLAGSKACNWKPLR